MKGSNNVAAGPRRLVGRPRDSTLDDQVLRTVRELLVERGYQRLSVQEVVRRCGVHAATISLRWETKATLVAAALLGDGELIVRRGSAQPFPTGDLRKDLRQMVTRINRFLADPVTRAALPVLWSEVHYDPGVHERLTRRRQEWSRLVGTVLESAVASGDAPPQVLAHAELLTDVLAGTAFARQGLGQRVLDETAVDELTDLVLNGLLTGERVPV